MCDEVLDPLFPVEGSKPKHPQCSWKDFGRNEALGKDNMLCGFPDLDSIDTDTPPDFNLAVRSHFILIIFAFSTSQARFFFLIQKGAAFIDI